MRNTILAATAAAALLAAPILMIQPAFAAQGGEGNNTGCNGVGNANSPCTGTTGGNGGNGGNGGAGGAGGRGGTGIGVGVGIARAQAAATARGGNATARGGAGGTGGAASATGGAGGQGQGGNATVTVQQDGGGGSGSGLTIREQRQAPGFAMGFMMPPQCGVSFSAGGNNVNGTGALGFSFETESCRKHRLAAALGALGEPTGGIALLCSMDEIAQAMTAAGRPCPGTAPAPTAATQVAAPVAAIAPTQRGPERPDWCATATRAERARHQGVCG